MALMNLQQQIDKVLGKVALRLQKDIVKETPVAWKNGGRLRNSISVVKEGNSWVVGTNVKYSEYVEKGIRGKSKPKTVNVGPAKIAIEKRGKNAFLNATDNAQKYLEEEVDKLNI